MEKQKIDFEDFTFNLILEKELERGSISEETYAILKSQHEQAVVTYEYTQVGFFYHYSFDGNIQAIQEKQNGVLGGFIFEVTDIPERLIEIILFVRDGIIACTEGHGYGEYLSEEFFDKNKLTEYDNTKHTAKRSGCNILKRSRILFRWLWRKKD